MSRTQRILMVAVLAFAVPAFAQHGRSGSTGGGPPASAGPGMGADRGGMSGDRGMSGDHSMGSHSGPSTTGQQGSMASQSPDKVLSHNPAIASKIKDLTGQDASAACAGFKNLGQCVSAAHVSKNLGIGFDELKAKTTGDGSVSLGKAIKELKPEADSKAEAKKANRQTEQDLKPANPS